MKLKSVKSDFQKGQIRQFASIGFPVRVRADSRSENPDPIPNNIGNHNLNTNNETKRLKNSGHASEYVSRERGVTIYPPNKNFVLKIFIRREMNMEEITINDDCMTK